MIHGKAEENRGRPPREQGFTPVPFWPVLVRQLEHRLFHLNTSALRDSVFERRSRDPDRSAAV